MKSRSCVHARSSAGEYFFVISVQSGLGNRAELTPVVFHGLQRSPPTRSPPILPPARPRARPRSAQPNVMKNTFALAGTAATLFAGVSAQDAGPACSAESMACAMDAACGALLQADPPDTVALIGNTLGGAMYT